MPPGEAELASAAAGQPRPAPGGRGADLEAPPAARDHVEAPCAVEYARRREPANALVDVLGDIEAARAVAGDAEGHAELADPASAQQGERLERRGACWQHQSDRNGHHEGGR
jgi:hypothetical protein